MSQTRIICRSVAPEDIKPDSYVAVLYFVSEFLPFSCLVDSSSMTPPEIVRVRWLPWCETAPMKVLDVCLPYVLVKQPTGEVSTLDTRRYQLARLPRSYGRKSYKQLKAWAKLQRKRDS